MLCAHAKHKTTEDYLSFPGFGQKASIGGRGNAFSENEIIVCVIWGWHGQGYGIESV